MMSEYFSVMDVSRKFKQTPRNVRKIVSELADEKNGELLFKDNRGEWRIHHLLLPKFTRKREAKEKYYALTIDPPTNLSAMQIEEIMKFVVDRMDNPNVEINYVVQMKKANGKSHVHCYINCDQRKKLLENLRLGFSNLSYKQTEIFDLIGWKQYMLRDGGTIVTVKYDALEEPKQVSPQETL